MAQNTFTASALYGAWPVLSRPERIVGEAISYLRRDAQSRARTTYYADIVEPEERLLGVIRFRDLIVAPPLIDDSRGRRRRAHQGHRLSPPY